MRPIPIPLLLVCLATLSLALPARAAAPESTAPVAITGPRLTVQGVLSEAARQSNVQLRAADSLANHRVTVAAEACPLRDLLEGLASVCEAKWEAVGSPAAPVYLLIPAKPEPEPPDVDRLLEQRSREGARQANASARSGTRGRLALYAKLLALPKEQVLERCEKPDPWACADVLGPRTRPIVAWITSLTETEREGLLSEGEEAWPMRTLPADLQHRLALWIGDRRHPPHGHVQAPNADYPPRFLTPEDRWANTLVHLQWQDQALVLEAEVPDIYSYQADVLHLTSNPPLAARQELASCGLRQATPEYREAAKAEQKEWSAAHPKTADSHPAKALPLAYLVPDPEEKDPRGQAQLTLLAGPRAQWSAADLLMQIARQGESVPVVSGLQSRNAPSAGPGASGFGTEVPKHWGLALD